MGAGSGQDYGPAEDDFLTDQEQWELARQHAGQSRRLIERGALSDGEKAIALACLAQAEASLVTLNLIDLRLPER
jgi:hypothetical protein